MATIIQFPKRDKPQPVASVVPGARAPLQPSITPAPKSAPKTAPKPTFKAAASDVTVASVVWHIAILCSPLIQWFMKWDCVYQFCRMIYHWDTPGKHSGLTFLMHFFLSVAFLLYIVEGKPK